MMTSTTYEVRGNSPYAKLFTAFFFGLMVAAFGLYAGQFVPMSLYIPLVIVEIGLLLFMLFARKRKAIGYPLMIAFMFISGLTLFPTIAYYVSSFGAGMVFRAAAISAVAFGGTAIYAMVSKADFRFLRSFLIVSLFALIGIAIMQMIFPVSETSMLITSGFGILIFIGFTLYDFSRLTHEGFSDRDIPLLVVVLYLDLVNLFIYILHFMGILSDD